MCKINEKNDDPATCYPCKEVGEIFQDKPDLSVQAVLKEVKETIFEKGKLARFKLCKECSDGEFIKLFTEFLVMFMDKNTPLADAQAFQQKLLTAIFGSDNDLIAHLMYTRLWYDESELEFEELATQLDENELTPDLIHDIITKLFQGKTCRFIAVCPWTDESGKAYVMQSKLARDRNFRDRYNLLKPDV